MAAFTEDTYRKRVRATRKELEKRGLSALLVFAQESHYYLFGYDGGGYVFFQCAILHTFCDTTVLLCRPPDVAQARETSNIKIINVWINSEDANPAAQLLAILDRHGLRGERIGIELDNFGCTAANYAAILSTFHNRYILEDCSDIVRKQRLVKSVDELNYIRKAAEIADVAVNAIQNVAKPGIQDSELTAAAMHAMLTEGGDMPPAGPLINSGVRAVYGRGIGGTRKLSYPDQILIELAGTYRRYNACVERILILGIPSQKQKTRYAIVEETLLEMLEMFRPGILLGTIDQIHRHKLDSAGFGKYRYSACGYSLGATFRPTWMDTPPIIYEGNPLVLESGMVFFPHVMLSDTDNGLGIGLGQTVVVTENGFEVLTKSPTELIIQI